MKAATYVITTEWITATLNRDKKQITANRCEKFNEIPLTFQNFNGYFF